MMSGTSCLALKFCNPALGGCVQEPTEPGLRQEPASCVPATWEP